MVTTTNNLILRTLDFYTDGAWSSKSEMGGWAAICIEDDQVIDVQSGYEPYSTNNRMELMAVIMALSALKTKCNISLYTDSKYVMNGITEWLANWKRNNWQTANKKQTVKNVDLWQRLDELTQQHEIRWLWVKGHNGHPENERCDALARGEVAKIKEEKIADKA